MLLSNQEVKKKIENKRTAARVGDELKKKFIYFEVFLHWSSPIPGIGNNNTNTLDKFKEEC